MFSYRTHLNGCAFPKKLILPFVITSAGIVLLALWLFGQLAALSLTGMALCLFILIDVYTEQKTLTKKGRRHMHSKVTMCLAAMAMIAIPVISLVMK